MAEAWLGELLEKLKQGLVDLYGERLKGVYLFGSFARGEQDAQSDIDLLIVLDQIPSYFGEIRSTGRLISSLALAYDVSISRVFVSESDWLRGEGPFLLDVRRHAVAA